MNFDPHAYGATVAPILALGENGQRLMPLAGDVCMSEDARSLIRDAGEALFPQSRAPQAALSGLYFYFGCWKDAHEIAQSVASTEANYWHALVHRQEPDAGNSAYWFQRVGNHAIFPALREAAIETGVDVGPQWKPDFFLNLCDKALRNPSAGLHRQVLEVQRAEWQLLFDYCASRDVPVTP